MNKHLWTYQSEGTADYGNDANDFYYEWVGLDLAKDIPGQGVKDGLVGMFEAFLGVGIGPETRVVVKAREGAIFIVKAGDKDSSIVEDSK